MQAKARSKKKLARGPRRLLRLAPRGGIIAVGGPPFAGRSPLAAMLSELLPRSEKMETVESLTQQTFRRADGKIVSGDKATRAIVDAAFERLRGSGPKPIVVLAARFDQPEVRRRLYERARASDAAFLYVEARSSNIRAIRRLFRVTAGGLDPAKQLAAYDAALARYVPVDARERGFIPCVLLRAVLSDLDQACATVLGAWHGTP